MGLHLVSSPPLPQLPLSQFLCGCVLSAGQDTVFSRAALAADWPLCVCFLSGRSEAVSGEVMAVLSSFKRRIHFIFVFHF